MAASEDIDIIVTQNDFDQAVRDLVPSVSQSEMDHYARIQQRFSRTAVDVIPSNLESQAERKADSSVKTKKGKTRAIE